MWKYYYRIYYLFYCLDTLLFERRIVVTTIFLIVLAFLWFILFLAVSYYDSIVRFFYLLKKDGIVKTISKKKLVKHNLPNNDCEFNNKKQILNYHSYLNSKVCKAAIDISMTNDEDYLYIKL